MDGNENTQGTGNETKEQQGQQQNSNGNSQQTQGNQQNTSQNNGQQNNDNNVDLKKVGDDAVSKLLSDYGFGSSDELKAMVDKVRADEEKNMSDSEKKDAQISSLTKKLAQSEKDRTLAESKLAAIKLGAKPELVDDLVAVAMSRVTKDKDVSAVVAEIKEGNTGSIYFGDTAQNAGASSGVVTRGKAGAQQTKGEGNKGKDNKFSFASEIAKSVGDKKGKQKKTYFK